MLSLTVKTIKMLNLRLKQHHQTRLVRFWVCNLVKILLSFKPLKAAKGQEPARAELVEQAKSDIANGLLGTEEDMEQAINALLQEL